MMHPQPLQARPFDQHQNHHLQHQQIPIRVDGDEGGGFEADSDEGMQLEEQMVSVGMHGGNGNSAAVNQQQQQQASRTSELTIAFEGEVYVFPSVTPEKVQAVLLLLGSRDMPCSMPSSEFLLQQNAGGVGDASRGSKLSRRIASLVRFREKRKERCFEKKIRYTCRKEVAQRMHRKNGQFASLKDCYPTGEGNGDSSAATSHEEVRRCQHCGISEKSTPAMRRGPAGPRTLCNACGLMWANKGTLRDLSKGGRSVPCEQIEPVTPNDVKPLAMDSENTYPTQNGQVSPDETKPVPLDSENPVRSDGQNMLETAGTDNNSLTIQVDHTSVNLGEQDLQETLDEFANASGSDFEIPANFDDQVDVDDSNLGTDWPGT